MKKSTLCKMGILVALIGCAETEPVVSDFNGDSVKIQQNTVIHRANPEDPKVLAQANKICGTRDRKPHYASTINNANTYTATHLFLCL